MAKASAADQAVQKTPEEWFELLMKKFDEQLPDPRVKSKNTPTTRRERLKLLWDYYIGDPPLPYISEAYADSFREILRQARANYSAMVIDAMADRSILQGVSTDADNTLDGDDTANLINENSGMDAVLRDMQTYLFALGESYIMIVPPAEGDPEATPLLTVVDPQDCVGVKDPIDPRRLAAFVKVFDDELNDQQVALLFIPGTQFRFLREPGQFTASFNLDEWTLAETVSLQNLETFGGMPVVMFENKLKMGEFEPHLDLLDRIMFMILQRLVITWYQAFRQRAIKGDLDGGEDFSEDENDVVNMIKTSAESGTDLKDVFRADPGALWVVPEGVEFWESSVADLTGLLNSIRDDVKEFAATTRTPLYLITPDSANQTAEGASAMREALADKVKDRQARQSPPMRLMYQLAFALAGKEAKGLRLRWQRVEKESLAGLGDFVQKTNGTLSRQRLLINYLGFSPRDAQLNETELMEESMNTNPVVDTAPLPDQPQQPAQPGQQPADQGKPADAKGQPKPPSDAQKQQAA